MTSQSIYATFSQDVASFWRLLGVEESFIETLVFIMALTRLRLTLAVQFKDGRNPPSPELDVREEYQNIDNPSQRGALPSGSAADALF